MANLLVLGAGWVGSAVADVARSHPQVREVLVVDPPFDDHLAARDESATEALRALVAQGGITTVLNACGRVHGDEDELDDANHRFVAWLCAALAGTGVRLVHVGSASEYGDPGSADPVDEATPARPVGAYATTKAAGTEVVLAARRDGLEATVARVFNIVGHPVPAVSPLHQWTSDLAALGPDGGEVVVWWPPTTRDFVMIDDVARALVDLAVLDGPLPPLVNVCSGVGLRFGEIVDALAAAMGVAASIRSLDRPGIEAVVGDPGLLASTIGWAPTMSATALAQRATGASASSGGAGGTSR
jgi:nucleoside-diphosphate-sugar epimerase